MTDLKRALYAFWAGFGVPAYLKDHVPHDAVLPYITYSVTQPNLNGQTVLTAFDWHRREGGGNVARSAMMDKIAEAIPVGGVMLPVGGGYVALYRNDTDFQTDWQDDTDLDVIGGRTSYIIQYYNP